MRDFESFFAQATGFQPRQYLADAARSGLPGAVWAPPGTGGSEIILAWLWRRLHGDARDAVPRRLVYALAQRAPLEPACARVRRWLANLGLDEEVAVHAVLGDRGSGTGDWRENMHRPAVVVGTVETLLSKALLRGYGVGAALAPIDFALVTNGAHWVLDQAELCPAAATTLRQLAGWVRDMRSAEPFGLTFLSCLPAVANGGSDYGVGVGVGELGGGGSVALAERPPGVAVRAGGTRVVRRAGVAPGDYAALSDRVAELHRAGTATVVVLNGVAAAQEVYRRLRGGEVACLLLHSRFRGAERVARLADLGVAVPGTSAADVAGDPGDAGVAGDGGVAGITGPSDPLGRVVVLTGEVASGLELPAATLVTEAAPWASLVRLAGCSDVADGTRGAALWWVPPPAGPLASGRLAVEAACAALSELEGARVTGEELASRPVVPASRAPDQVPVIGRAEFLALFDTTPALFPVLPDAAVGRYVSDAPELDVDVAWATWTPGPDGAPDPDVRYPAPEYRCRVPVSEAVKLALTRPVWRRDRADGRWVPADAGWRPAPFDLLLVPGAAGGYDPAAGFDLSSRAPVRGCPELLTPDEIAAIAERAAAEAAALGRAAPGAAVESAPRRWQSVDEHSEQVRDQCAALLAVLRPAVPAPAVAATVAAAYLHDAGKAHPTWQDALCALADPADADTVTAGRPWAKSGTTGALHFAGGVSFRHELGSLLLIDGPFQDLLAGLAEQDLVRYLALAHHGQLRMRVGDSAAGEDAAATILGLSHGAMSDIPPMLGHPATTLTIDLTQFSPHGARSWSAVAQALLDKFGPFTLAYLETVVRIADWRGSGGRELATDIADT